MLTDKQWKKIAPLLPRLGNFRHLVVRYDRSLRIYEAFFHIACFMIALRRL
jgi:transposase